MHRPPSFAGGGRPPWRGRAVPPLTIRKPVVVERRRQARTRGRKNVCQGLRNGERYSIRRNNRSGIN